MFRAAGDGNDWLGEALDVIWHRVKVGEWLRWSPQLTKVISSPRKDSSILQEYEHMIPTASKVNNGIIA